MEDTIQAYSAPVIKVLFSSKLALLLDFNNQANELSLLVTIKSTLGNTIQVYRAGIHSNAILFS